MFLNSQKVNSRINIPGNQINAAYDQFADSRSIDRYVISTYVCHSNAYISSNIIYYQRIIILNNLSSLSNQFSEPYKSAQ